MLAIGNNELGEKLGGTIKCPHCGEKHAVCNHQTDGNQTILDWYKCGDEIYVCGIKGKSIMHKFEPIKENKQ